MKRPPALDRGFTLIELLVVIAIIVMLSSFVLASLNSARVKARNSARLQEVTAYAKATELFQTGNTGVYPDGGINWTVAPSYRCLGRGAASCFAGSYTGNATLDAQFAPNIKATVAGSDTGLALGGYAYRCIVSANGAPCTQYTIIYQLETTNALCAGGLVVDPAYNGTNTYCQLISCAAGKSPVRTGGPTTPYTCQ